MFPQKNFVDILMQYFDIFIYGDVLFYYQKVKVIILDDKVLRNYLI